MLVVCIMIFCHSVSTFLDLATIHIRLTIISLGLCQLLIQRMFISISKIALISMVIYYSKLYLRN